MAIDKKKDKDNPQAQNQDQLLIPSRRNLLKGAGIVGAAAIGVSTTAHIIAAESDPSRQVATAIQAREALEVLTAEEAETLAAICDCLIPSDDNGPGAKEARAVHYIDRSLASHNAGARHNYMIGLSAINDYARRTHQKPFNQLMVDQQNAILLAVQTNQIDGFAPSGSGFFNMVRSHTIDGTFCDPYYGGNQDFVGWDMIHYPGIRLSASETDVAQGAALEPTHQSAYDHSTYTKLASIGDASNQGGGDHA